MNRKNISSGAKWESEVGYSRAVKVGSHIYISGTTAIDENGQVVGVGDAYAQTVQIIKIIEKSLTEAGASLKNVVRTRMFVTNIDDWREIGKAHGEFFREIKPATTMIEVNRLIEEEILVEIEAEAIVDE